MTRHPLTLAVAQPSVVLHDVASNVDRHVDLVRQATDSRVVVFPELSLTGYAMDVEAISIEDPRLRPLIEACDQAGVTALVGAAVGDIGGRFISTLVIEDGHVRIGYRKMNLGGEEPRAFIAGSHPAVLDVDRWRLGLSICKDSGVPAHAAETCRLDIDVYVASVCEHDADAHVAGERAARVIGDHGVWVATASFAGPTGGGFEQTAGGSAIWNPTGAVVAALDDRPDQWCAGTLIDPQEARRAAVPTT